jgi:hypothetical protein
MRYKCDILLVRAENRNVFRILFFKKRKTIGDRQFVSFVQFFLHKLGEVTLEQLRIRLSENGNGPIVIVNREDRELPLADVPIPKNIKNFESIIIRFVCF